MKTIGIGILVVLVIMTLIFVAPFVLPFLAVVAHFIGLFLLGLLGVIILIGIFYGLGALAKLIFGSKS